MVKISDLNDDQKSHLAWRLDHNTGCGFLTASAVARGDHGDLDVKEVFINYGDVSARSAAILTKKVLNFVVDHERQEALEISFELYKDVLRSVNGLTPKYSILVFKELAKSLSSLAKSHQEILDLFPEDSISSIDTEVKN